MLRVVSLITLLLWSVSAQAEPALVQSGEHVGFTRLVVKVLDERSWSIKQVDRKVMLKLTEFDKGFDTTRIFDLIPRDRIERVDANEDTLTIHLGCECDVSAFNVDGGYVALDIAYVAQGQRPPLLKKPTSPQTITKPGRAIKQKPALLKTDDLPNRTELSGQDIAVLSDLQSRLSTEIGRAATRGVLEPNQVTTPTHRRQIDTSAFEHLLPPITTSKNPDRESGNIRLTTSMDTPTRSHPAERKLSDQGQWCPPDDATDVTAWGDMREFDVQISEARLGLFGEFDKLNPDAAITLAKKYIFFGFGAEARQVLNLDPALATKQQILLDLADIMESGGSRPDLSIRSFSDCTGSISLWALLADPDRLNDPVTDSTAALRTLGTLPAHLRQYLAPIVSGRFLSRGHQEHAATALRNLERMPDVMPPSAEVANANLGMDRGETAQSIDDLKEIAMANVAESPQALISLLNAKIVNQKTIEPEFIGLAEAYAQELRGTAFEAELRRVHILALIETNNFDRASSEMKAMTNLGTAELLAELRTQLVQKITTAASDIVFLDIVFRQPAKGLVLLDDSTKIPVAARLLVLGFASNAAALVETIPDRPLKPKRQELAAKVALALEQPYQALAELIGIDSEISDILRAEAKYKVGAFEDAHDIYQAASQPEAAAQSAWLAGNWRDLTDAETPIFGQIKALAEPTSAPGNPKIGMLNRSGAALKESGEARQTMEELLRMPELRATVE